MKLLALVFIIALIAAPTASAHQYWHRKADIANRLEERIIAYRVKHEEGWLFSGLVNLGAVIALQQANYQEHKWTLKIGGVPYPVWAEQFFPFGGSVMMLSIRPHGAPWTPRMVLKRWKHKPVYKASLLFPPFTKISVRAGDVHQHKGDYKGKGRCRVYYVSLSIA